MKTEQFVEVTLQNIDIRTMLRDHLERKFLGWKLESYKEVVIGGYTAYVCRLLIELGKQLSPALVMTGTWKPGVGKVEPTFTLTGPTVTGPGTRPPSEPRTLYEAYERPVAPAAASAGSGAGTWTAEQQSFASDLLWQAWTYVNEERLRGVTSSYISDMIRDVEAFFEQTKIPPPTPKQVRGEEPAPSGREDLACHHCGHLKGAHVRMDGCTECECSQCSCKGFVAGVVAQ